jgi:hypothetical protein
LPLLRLISRTYPPAESASRNCCRASLRSAFCTSWTPSSALGRSSTLPLCTDCTRYQPEPESRKRHCCQAPSLRVYWLIGAPSVVARL